MMIFNQLTVKHHDDIQSAHNDQPQGDEALFGSKLYGTLYIIIHSIIQFETKMGLAHVTNYFNQIFI